MAVLESVKAWLPGTEVGTPVSECAACGQQVMGDEGYCADCADDIEGGTERGSVPVADGGNPPGAY